MENFTKFIKEVKKLLLDKIEKKELDVSAKRIMSSNIFVFEKVNGKYRYFIDQDIVDKFPSELTKQIESIWILNCQSGQL
jgi:hypothetical protein